jgi:S1-C subfamily serine protease
VVAINGQTVKDFEDLINYLAANTSVGDVISVTVMRDGEVIEIEITLEERPGDL